MAAPVLAVESQLSQEAMNLAAQHGIQERVREMVEITKGVFPTARRFEVYVEDDPDIPNERYIIYDVKIPEFSLDQAWEARQLWGKELLRVFSYPRNFLPVLRLDFAD
jgi:hypothetical protein